MALTTILLLLLGLLLLIAGAELLVRGASRLAAAFQISPIVIGLTVVAYGTSAPELAVSCISTCRGQGDIAFGNVVGSNIFNILLILGVAALIVPLHVVQQLVRLDVPIMIGAAALAWLFAADGVVSRPEGIVLLAGMVGYTLICIRQSRKESAKVAAEYEREYGRPTGAARHGLPRQLLYILAGLCCLLLGSHYLVEGAVALASAMGVSELCIGLTVVAAGTSMPECATSVVASLRGEKDIAVGNVVGSNIFNVLGVLGVASVVGPAGVPVSAAALHFDMPVMLAVSVACLPIFFTGQRISRWEGGLFLFYYCAYTTCLVLASMKHAALDTFGKVMLLFVVPLTVVTLLVAVVRAVRASP